MEFIRRDLYSKSNFHDREKYLKNYKNILWYGQKGYFVLFSYLLFIPNNVNSL